MADFDNLRILVIREGDLLVAQCLEYDICTFAEDMRTLRERMDGQIECERQTSRELHGAEFAGIDPAPAEFHKMWDDAEKFAANHRPYSMALAAPITRLSYISGHGTSTL